MKIFKGKSVALGIVTGNVVLYIDESFVNVEPRKIEKEKIPAEIDRIENAIVRSKKQLHTIKNKLSKSLGVSEAGIFHSLILILEDKYLMNKIEDYIREFGMNAEYAVIKSIKEYENDLSKSKNAYLRERIIDLEDIKKRLLKNLGISMNEKEFSNVVNSIAVVKSITASDSIELINLGIKGLVLEKGGSTSHAAILARAMGIPTIVGVKNMVREVLAAKSDDESVTQAILDAYSGKLILNPDDETKQYYIEKEKKKIDEKQLICEESSSPAIMLDGTPISVYANLGAKFNIENVVCQGGIGIGLYRTEFQYMLRRNFPSEDDLFNEYADILKSLGDRPMILRMLDVGGDKFLPYYDHAAEKNPELGERSIRFLLNNEEILRTQLRAVLRASMYGKLKIMLPLVSCVEEITKIHKIIEEEKENLSDHNVEFSREKIPVGIMVELPATVMNLENLVKYVDFFSIGSNDLTQYTLGIDREDPSILDYYSSSHPAVLRLIDRCVKVAGEYDKEISICGEMASEFKYIPLLLGFGMKNLSMNIMNIKDAKKFIRMLHIEKCQELVDKVFGSNSVEEIENNLNDFIKDYEIEE